MQLVQLLESSNILISGGSINTGREQIDLEPSGNFESVEDLRRTPVKLPGSNQVLALEDIVSIGRGYVDPPVIKVHASGNSTSSPEKEFFSSSFIRLILRESAWTSFDERRLLITLDQRII